MRPTTLLLAILGTLMGCQASNSDRPNTSLLNHVVLIKLQQPEGINELLADCNRLLPRINQVDSYWCGKHFDIGRAEVDSDYDVALCVGFQTQAGYEQYLIDPSHMELVNKWKPRFESIRIYDVKDTY